MSITEKCNLRCIYCMPSDGIKLTPEERLMSLDERKRLISLFASHGVNKIRFTGGEPTINKTLPALIEHCRSLSSIQSVGITTNGLVLKSQLDRLCDAGLTHVNISLDTLQPLKYEQISRRDRKGLSMILSALYDALSRNLTVKINCVLIRSLNFSEIAQFVELTREAAVDVRFIEVMPFEDNHWDPQQLVPYFEALDSLQAQVCTALLRSPLPYAMQGYPLEKALDGKKDPHDTTKWYRESGTQGTTDRGRVGFITSMSRSLLLLPSSPSPHVFLPPSLHSHFCGGCNRLRITADGKLKVCLFGNEELSLVQAMRGESLLAAGCCTLLTIAPSEGLSDEELTEFIASGVRQKKKALGGHDSPASIAASENRPMILIGG
jgi:molybdenum cofactor biosynthesis enzyme MoaA